MPKTRPAAKTRARVQRRVTNIEIQGAAASRPPKPNKRRSGKRRSLNSEIRIGISGWRYAGWRGKFYPKDLAQHRELEFAGRTFNSVEINGSFYSLQLPSSYKRWYEATPADFLFSVKGGRFITHMKKLRDVETPLANFFASGVIALREKLGPILWQLPPSLGFDAERLRNFFELLPRNTQEATKLAKKHDAKLKARAFTKIDIERPLRHAMEVRHPTFMNPEFFALLREYNVAFVVADTAGKFPYAEDLTADFVYIRLHGAEKLYVSGYNDRALDWWAKRIDLWRKGRQPRDAKLIADYKIDPPSRSYGAAGNRSKDVFVYFDNDAKVHAPFDAIRLSERLRVER
jgi:uncharacterized protein YecE (DUF72 family)